MWKAGAMQLIARTIAMICFGFAIAKFWIGYFATFHTEDEATASGVSVAHGFPIDRSTLIAAFAGLLLFVLSSLILRKRKPPA